MTDPEKRASSVRSGILSTNNAQTDSKYSKKKLWAVAGSVIVIVVMAASFTFRSQIEKFAMTGYLGVFIACFASTSTILLPAPGVLVVLRYSQFLKPAAVVLLGGLGTSLGEMTGYMLGRSGTEITGFRNDSELLKWFRKRTYLTVFVFSVLPLPVFDIAGVIAGVNKADPFKVWLYCFCGKVLKLAAYVAVVRSMGSTIANYV